MSKNLWILSEERPKTKVIEYIIGRFSKQQNLAIDIHALKIIPILDGRGNFSFWYEVSGASIQSVERIMIGIVSGKSSFVDFLVFFQNEKPKHGDQPTFIMEETKTDDAESRNTGTYQRASKFVYADLHFPNVEQVMYYNLQIDQKDQQTATNVFGTRCQRTLGIQIEGKNIPIELNQPFRSLDEMIALKSQMKKAPKGNVPIEVAIKGNQLEISGRLIKNNSLAHDPNIGALALIAATARKLGWDKKIVITRHGLSQSHLGPTNKFVRIANQIEIELDGLELPKSVAKDYWEYDTTGEKLASIFLHVTVESFTHGRSIFENHAGAEKGYFFTSDHIPLQLAKYVPGSKPRKRVEIPDLILLDSRRREILNLEGKPYSKMQLGIDTLGTYDSIEKLYLKKYYPEFTITRSVVLFGSDKTELHQDEVCLLVNKSGEITLGPSSPNLVTEGISNLKKYWAENRV